MYKLLIVFLAALSLVACGDAAKKAGGNANNSNNINNVNNLNNVNNTNNVNNSNNNTVIGVDDYDQSCEFDENCSLVTAGDVCGCLDICQSAISSEAVSQFQSDVEAITCSGPNTVPCPAAACQEQMAICNAGACEAATAVGVFARDYDQTCETAADCLAVQEGRVCQGCSCPSAVINKDELEQFLSDIGNAEAELGCNPQPADCQCAQFAFDCIEGQCAAL